MRIIAERKRYKNDSTGICSWEKGDVSEIKETDFFPCCDKAKEAWANKFIGFGEFDSMLNKNKHVCIYQCSPYPEGAVYDEMEIEYCPFCAAKIQVHISG